ncbi:MAG: nucleotidyltransferase domain-containing protein [Actinomycetota bacterium]|nr:nucleotidyltransferase domain-containing protein [Actinomycetota bacterium]MDQ2958258.1 nucleotidyltransferase domain-containing protein [Actinomycetota bacterium]
MGSVPAAVFAAMPAAVHAELDRRGIRLAQVAEVVDLRPDEVLLLAGSYATGEANPTSDLDLLVLSVESGSRAPAGSSNHPSIFGDSYDITLADLTVNVEYVPQSRFLELCDMVAAARSAPAGPEIGNFQALELRLAQRAVTGIALVGAELLDSLRRRLHFETVRSSAAALSFVMTMSLLEDTRVLDPPGQLLMLRGAGELLVMAALNAVGPITYDIKHLFPRSARLAAEPAAPSALRDAEQLVFIDRLPVDEGVSLVLDHAQDLYRRLAADPVHREIIEMLQPFLAGWSWTDRVFD